LAAAACVLALGNAPAFAQEDDAVLKLAEPDFTLISLPTSLRLPHNKSAFRVTHRFVRPLDCELCQDNWLEDFFGTDNGAVIGIEYRYGILPGLQIGAYRARERKTLQFFGQYGVWTQAQRPLEMAILGSVEGTDNFSDEYSGTIGVILTRLIGEYAAIHVEPTFVGNTNLDEPSIDEDNTFLLNLGTRIRIRPTVYVTAEVMPRIGGYTQGGTQAAFSIEKRAGGHMFQLNFSNSLGTTPGSIARGGTADSEWFMGFNITRKFF
jgi:hypothetical protein